MIGTPEIACGEAPHGQIGGTGRAQWPMSLGSRGAGSYAPRLLWPEYFMQCQRRELPPVRGPGTRIPSLSTCPTEAPIDPAPTGPSRCPGRPTGKSDDGGRNSRLRQSCIRCLLTKISRIPAAADLGQLSSSDLVCTGQQPYIVLHGKRRDRRAFHMRCRGYCKPAGLPEGQVQA